MSVSRHCLLGGWHSLGSITHKKKYRQSDYNNLNRIFFYLQGAWNSLHTWCSFTFLSIDWLIDWLIDHCLTSNEQYVSYIHDENKSNHNIKKLFRNEGRDCSTGSTTEKAWRVFAAATTQLFSKSTKDVFSVALSKHVTHNPF
jgi:hypothetical protein